MLKYDFEKFLEAIQRYRVVAIPLVPPVAHQLAKSDLPNQYDLSSLKRLMVSAAPTKPEVVKVLRDRYKVSVRGRYMCCRHHPVC